MSYQSIETSIDSGMPLELYKFTVAGTVYSYTSGQETQTVSSVVYTPAPIRRTRIEQSRELARAALDIILKRDHPIADLFVAFVPSSFVLLTIYRKHDGDANFIQAWQGSVKSVTWQGAEATLKCEPTLSILKRKGPRRNFGGTCQHALYSVGGCTMNKENFRTNALLTAVDGELLTAAVIGTKVVTWFPSGFAERTNGEIRFIAAQLGDTVTVLTPFNNLLPGETIALYAGCAHDIETCATKFVDVDHPTGNEENFMGFHVNPKRNPFIVGLK